MTAPRLHFQPGLGEGFNELRTLPKPNVDTPKAFCGCFLLLVTSDFQE